MINRHALVPGTIIAFTALTYAHQAMAFSVPVPSPDILSLFGAAAVSMVLVQRWRKNRKR